MYLVCTWTFNIFVYSISVILSEIAFIDYEVCFGDFSNFLYTRKLRHRDIKWCDQNHTSSESGSCSVVSDSLQPHGLEPARLLCPWNSLSKNTEWDIIPFSRGSSWPRDRNWVSCIADRFSTVWATREAQVAEQI